MVRSRDDDAVIYRCAAITLRAGAFASLGAMLVGLVWWLAQGSPGGADALSLKSLPLDRLWSRLLALDPVAVLNLGVLLLLVTPAATLLSQVGAYAASRNWRYAAITLLVALILLLGLAISILR